MILWQTDADKRFLAAKGSVPIGIGRNTHIKKAIIDKNARIGENVKVILASLSQRRSRVFDQSKNGSLSSSWVLFLQIVNSDNVQEAARETDGYFIKSGIVTIIKDALIPSGTII